LNIGDSKRSKAWTAEIFKAKWKCDCNQRQLQQ